MTRLRPPLDWDAAALQERLAAHLPGIGVEVAASLPSTSTELLERLRGAPAAAATVRPSVESRAFKRRAADLEPVLLVAEHQTAGRGRQGRTWHAQAGASLTFSLALPFEPVDWSGLSLAVGVALAEALDPRRGEDAAHIGLKWPNDLWLVDASGDVPRKLGGVLVETITAGARRVAVIGIGLNVEPVDAPEATTGVAALSELDATADAPGTLARIAEPLALALREFERAGFAAFAARYAARDVLAGRPVRTSHADVPEGIARGVEDDGALRLDTPGGRRVIRSGEVSVRPAPTPDARAC